MIIGRGVKWGKTHHLRKHPDASHPLFLEWLSCLRECPNNRWNTSWREKTYPIFQTTSLSILGVNKNEQQQKIVFYSHVDVMLDSSCRDFNTPKPWLSPSVFLISNQPKVALLRLQSLALDTEVCQSWTTRLPGVWGFWVKGSKYRWGCVFLMFLESIVTWFAWSEGSHCEVMLWSTCSY